MRLLAVLLVVASACVPAVADPRLAAPALGETPHVHEVHGAAPGDVVQLGALLVQAPTRGVVFAEIIFDDGETESLELRSDDDGRVALHDVDAQAAVSASSAGSSPSACADTARSLLSHRWDTRLDWWFNAGSNPGETSLAKTEAALVAATTNVTRSDNDCGMGDQVSATHLYKGRTATGTQVNNLGGCSGDGDGKNVVGFGDLPAGVLGVACVWSTLDGVAVESDVRLNKADYDWVNSITDSCENRFHVESVMTHERGHTFGLGHVSESAHGRLTMSTAIDGPCRRRESTLGRGDVLGLREKY